MNGKGISLVDSDEDVTEVGIGNNGPWSYKNETIYVDLMDEVVKNYNSRVNSKAKSFRKFGFPHYAAMIRVLRDNTAKGMNAFASTQSPSRTDSSHPELKIKKEANLEDLEVDNFKAGVKERGKAIAPKAISKSRKRDSYSANLKNNDSLGLFSQCSSILNGMDDLDGLSYFKAMTKLKEDSTWRRIFLGMPDKRKMDW
ncbi:hypothetical protein Acr_00g0075320 [Actinidia rufa]|uniref:Uncharacterized protein n=1 Tax=Actinidia rufa TaxID=165716 RepID=A0A7J0DTZ0_9ERIC|nr:hypothetical protein Acr_00g0075320 [Actinidia rufa]